MRGRALLAALLALGVWPAAAPAQQPPDVPLQELPVQTVPKIEGARFMLNGRTFRTDANGQVTVPGDGQPRLRDRVKIPETTIAPGLRVQFSRRKEDFHIFNRLYRVRFSFVDLQGRPISASRVSRITLKGSHGDRVTLKPDRARWLQGTRMVPTKSGFREKRLSWVVEEALVDGQNVVNRAQQSFEPATTRDFRITLLFYPAHITVRDALFGFPAGSHVNIEHPNGKVRRYRLGPNGEARVPSLPRGQYIVTVEGAGISFEHPLALSRRQVVDLELLSFLDIGVIIAVLVSIAIGLLALGRRLPSRSALVRRIRSLKALAGERGDSPRPTVASPLEDEGWRGELHLDFGHLAGLLRQHGGVYVGWEGDLRKTLGASTIIDAVESRLTLVVCANRAKHTVWATELRRLLPAHDIKVLPDLKSKRDAMLAKVRKAQRSGHGMVLVMGYEALAIIAGNGRSGRSGQVGDGWRRLGDWDLVVADEARNVRNAKALTTGALGRVPSKHRLALSGSRGDDHADELFEVLPWLFPRTPGALEKAVVCHARWSDADNGGGKLVIGLMSAQLETLYRQPGIFEVYSRRAEETDPSEQRPLVELAPAPREGRRP